MSKIIDLRKLELPNDVWFENQFIDLEGTPTGADDEIVVLSQIGRMVTRAYLCHLSKGYRHRRGDEKIPVVLDYPQLKKLKITKPCLNVHTFNGIKYTMACLADKEYGNANWLF